MELKAKIRAWLIEIVREAIRIELVLLKERMCELGYPVSGGSPNFTSNIPSGTASKYTGITKETWDRVEQSKPASNQETSASFEQMESNALKSQEKYYEPERL